MTNFSSIYSGEAFKNTVSKDMMQDIVSSTASMSRQQITSASRSWEDIGKDTLQKGIDTGLGLLDRIIPRRGSDPGGNVTEKELDKGRRGGDPENYTINNGMFGATAYSGAFSAKSMSTIAFFAVAIAAAYYILRK